MESVTYLGYRGRAATGLKKRNVVDTIMTAWTVVKLVAMVGAVALAIDGGRSFHRTLPTPISLTTVDVEDVAKTRLTKALAYLKCPTEKVEPIGEGIIKGAGSIGVDPVLIAVLLRTESAFSLTARSPKGYVGLMQTPQATQYADVDILYGCRILEEKLRIARGDLRDALAMYKGGKNPMAYRQADEVLSLYRRTKGAI